MSISTHFWARFIKRNDLIQVEYQKTTKLTRSSITANDRQWALPYVLLTLVPRAYTVGRQTDRLMKR